MGQRAAATVKGGSAAGVETSSASERTLHKVDGHHRESLRRNILGPGMGHASQCSILRPFRIDGRVCRPRNRSHRLRVLPGTGQEPAQVAPYLKCRDSPFAGRVRAVFDNPVACNQITGRDGPGDETPSPGRTCGIFQSDRSRRFSGSSRLASKCEVREAKEGIYKRKKGHARQSFSGTEQG